ncbi:MAG: hypothetical protein WBK76_00525 [Candidatus Saccharimonadales bacterium]
MNPEIDFHLACYSTTTEPTNISFVYSGPGKADRELFEKSVLASLRHACKPFTGSKYVLLEWLLGQLSFFECMEEVGFYYIKQTKENTLCISTLLAHTDSMDKLKQVHPKFNDISAASIQTVKYTLETAVAPQDKATIDVNIVKAEDSNGIR